MNKQIKKLADQAGIGIQHNGIVLTKDVNAEEALDQFAQLIVRECQNICLNDDWDEAAGWGKMFAQKIQLQLGVKQHFGIEE